MKKAHYAFLFFGSVTICSVIHPVLTIIACAYVALEMIGCFLSNIRSPRFDAIANMHLTRTEDACLYSLILILLLTLPTSSVLVAMVAALAVLDLLVTRRK